jgi:hypothetical protein
MKPLCLLALLLAAAAAQTPPLTSAPVAASAEDSRLRQMETIYQQQLRSLHVPVVAAYVTELQRLAATAADPSPYQREITRIQGLLAAGGVVDLTGAARALKTPAEPPPEPGAPPVPRLRRGTLALTPALAASIQPRPDTSASPEAAAIGEIEWRIESLPPGHYEVLLHYACPQATAPLTLECSVADHRLATNLGPEGATRDDTTYSILRLGRLNLPRELRGETLRLRAGTGNATAPLLVKQLILTPSPSAD